MSDALTASRLPDLPTAGYGSLKERQTTDLIMFFLRGVERNRPLLLMLVVDGIDKWRKVAGKAWALNSGGRATAMTRELLDRVFEYLVLLAGPNPAEQLLILHGQMQAMERAKWDRRRSTVLAFQAQQRKALADLRHAMKRKPS